MPDVREIMLLMPGGAGRFRWGKLLSRAKFTVRWAVAATARTPLSYLYRAVYKWHAWYAVRVARRFSGTQAVYITRSMGKGEVAIGVSDVDMAVVGNWPEAEQIRLMRALGTLSAISPLYDSTLWQTVFDVANLRNLWETDYFFQARFNEGRSQWKLAYGEDVLASLPPVPSERMAGGYYMEVRSWWLHFILSAFGDGPTARDAIFRNSIAYKASVEIARVGRALETSFIAQSRRESLSASIEASSGWQRGFLERLDESARKNHVSFRGDIRADSVRFLLPLLNRIHIALVQRPPFQPALPFEVDADPAELLRSPAAITHATQLIEHVRKTWPSYRAAYLAPSAACFALDDLMLLIEADPAQLPTFSQLRDLCKLHTGIQGQLVQQISLYLLLPGGACRLELANNTEMWRVLIFPLSTPDLFTLIARPEFLLDGEPGPRHWSPAWNPFARDLVMEELGVRRSVLSKVTPDVFPSSIEIVRNVYRHLQLEVLARSSESGPPKFALSPSAIERELDALQLSDAGVLQSLREAYLNELAGRKSDVRPLIPQIVTYLKRFL